MSYLHPLRLHFAGKFQANVSTVNNDPGHFDNASFLPNYQELGNGTTNGWFNPQGDAAWRLLGCTITAAWLPSGPVTSSDPVLKMIVADSDTQAPAKLCDLDSEQQLVSEIWGLQVRIADKDGRTLMRSDFEPAAFIDIWDRAIGQQSRGDVDAGATYQSVLTNVQWGDVSKSKFLKKLKEASSDGLLSIKFNVDNINMDYTSPDFMCGRIAGTIGPATKDEPKHMVLGRQFMTSAAPGQFNFFFPIGQINYFPAVVDDKAKCIFLDLGNALSTVGATGQPSDLGDLQLTIAGSTESLGVIPSQGAGGYASDPTWYARTAGVVALPLTGKQRAAIAARPLTLASKTTAATISEWASGAFVRADCFVYRLSPGETPAPEIAVYATQWGRPLADVEVTFALDPSQLQPSNFIDTNDVPPVGTPATALTFNPTFKTDQHGKATFTFTNIGDPLTPRYFNGGKDYGLDGQVYGIRPALANAMYNTAPANQWNFISILLWSGFSAINPTWTDVEPIFVQYANLYPVMNRFLNLGDYESVVKHASLLTLAFGLDPKNPNAMPVTRDLSPAKRQAILSFLANPRPGAQKAETPMLRAAAPKVSATSEKARPGGKAQASLRRLAVVQMKGAAS